MTYRELLERLAKLSQSQLDDDVTVHYHDNDEYMTVMGTSIVKETDILDAGHFVLEIS